MKTINLIFTLILWAISTTLFSQIDLEGKTINTPLHTSSVTTTIKSKLDPVNHDLTNGLRDDTTLYYTNSNVSRGLDSNQRLIYFLHGLGGTPNSWKGSYDGLINYYQYRPKRPNYYTNQRNFLNATYEAHANMGTLEAEYFRDYFNADTVYKYSPPYVIGHSQGGLVARDMDMKHDTNDLLDPRLDYTNRRFWGIVTFGTPHAGSYFAVRQDEISRLASELTTTLGKNTVTRLFNGAALKVPILKGKLSSVSLTAGELIDELHKDSILDNIFNLIAKDNRDPITKQYGPGDSTYVNDTLGKFINPNMPKALFYGIESDPLIWHLTYFMITKDPGEYGSFGANDDDDLATNMEDMRMKLITQAHVDLGHANWWRGRWWHPQKYTQANIHLSNMSSNMSTADYLTKANMLYKDVLGTYADSVYTRWLLKRNCTEKTVIKRKRLFNNTYDHYMTLYRYYSVNPGCSCGPALTFPNYKIGNRWRSKTLSYTYTDIYGDIIMEVESDAVVLKPSQMAFPGCSDMNKMALREVYNRTTNTFVGVPNSVNHMQMRNCLQTEAALRRIYNGDGTMPIFFRLEPK
jgi:hypothetical protein